VNRINRERCGYHRILAGTSMDYEAFAGADKSAHNLVVCANEFAPTKPATEEFRIQWV